MEVGGSASFDTTQFNVSAKDGIILDAGGGSVTLKGHSFVKEFKTSEFTDKVSGNASTQVGG